MSRFAGATAPDALLERDESDDFADKIP